MTRALIYRFRSLRKTAQPSAARITPMIIIHYRRYTPCTYYIAVTAFITHYDLVKNVLIFTFDRKPDRRLVDASDIRCLCSVVEWWRGIKDVFLTLS